MSHLSYDSYAKSLSDRELKLEIECGHRAIPGSQMLAALEDEQARRQQES
jgi:hypothetical protein